MGATCTAASGKSCTQKCQQQQRCHAIGSYGIRNILSTYNCSGITAAYCDADHPPRPSSENGSNSTCYRAQILSQVSLVIVRTRPKSPEVIRSISDGTTSSISEKSRHPLIEHRRAMMHVNRFSFAGSDIEASRQAQQALDSSQNSRSSNGSTCTPPAISTSTSSPTTSQPTSPSPCAHGSPTRTTTPSP